MQQSVATSVRYLLVISQVIASCLGQYLSGTSNAMTAGIIDGGLGPGHIYNGRMGMVTSLPMGYGAEYMQGLGYGNGYGQGLSYGGGYDQISGYGGPYGPVPNYSGGYGPLPGYGGGYGPLPGYGGGYGPLPGYGVGYGSRYDQGISYGGGYDQVLGYGNVNGAASALPTNLGGGYGVMGPGLGYSGSIANENGAVNSGYGDGTPTHPYTQVHPPMIAGPTITSPQQQAHLTSNENTNTNININNNLGKERRGLLNKRLLGIPQL